MSRAPKTAVPTVEPIWRKNWLAEVTTPIWLCGAEFWATVENRLWALAAGQEGAGAVKVAVDPIVRAAFAASMTSLFEAAFVVVVLGLIAIIVIPHVELRQHHVHAEPVAEPGEGSAGIIEA